MIIQAIPQTKTMGTVYFPTFPGSHVLGRFCTHSTIQPSVRTPRRTRAINTAALAFHAEIRSPRRRSTPRWVPPQKGHSQPVTSRNRQGTPQPVTAYSTLNPTPAPAKAATPASAFTGEQAVCAAVLTGKGADSMFQEYIFCCEKTNLTTLSLSPDRPLWVSDRRNPPRRRRERDGDV